MATKKVAKGIDLLPSGRYRARVTFAAKTYSQTFDTFKQAEAWQRRTRNELAAGTYAGQRLVDEKSMKELAPTFKDYAQKWLAERSLKPRTREAYRGYLRRTQKIDGLRLDEVTVKDIKSWYSSLKAPPVMKAHIYGLVRTIYNTAYQDDLVPANPCRIRGAGSVKRKTRTEVPSPEQVVALADAMPSIKYRTMVLVAAWCGLRFGELTELRRKDFVLDGDETPVKIKVRRAVTRVGGEFIVGTPKSETGVRDVAIPPHVRVDIQAYLRELSYDPDEIVFPASRTGGYMQPSSLYKPFYRAREEAGLPELRWHDLRHFSATTAAGAGATLAKLQLRLGHSTVDAAMRYQHAASNSDERIAEAMSRAALQAAGR